MLYGLICVLSFNLSMKKAILFITACILQSVICLSAHNIKVNTITEKGAWCWFADPRSIHHENESGTINSTYIGYIDVNGYIKATQIDHLNNRTSEVMIRSYFQPDDHNNPTFLVLPDERIMVFYSRHTDESCFYYRVSKSPGDISTLGKEFRLETSNNTTYPSPFILSDDPDYIYLCWRGTAWHPTIAKLSMPDIDDEVHFEWGPYQIMQSQNGAGGVRPYAKYASNGRDKIYLAYTTTHPDNQSENWIYLNYIDINQKTLNDIKGNKLSTINGTDLHEVDITPAYRDKFPYTVVDDTPLRNWIWDLTLDKDKIPVMTTVRISKDKSTHDYYHIRWTGDNWQKTFIANAGGHFHQSPDIEKCYSGGLVIDKYDSQTVYGSVPVKGIHGLVYELKKYTIDDNGVLTSEEQLTFDSQKNNVRPYSIADKDSENSLVWMQGDYYDWIVSSQRPQGFPTAIRTNMNLPEEAIDLKRGLLINENIGKLTAVEKRTFRIPDYNSFTITLSVTLDKENYGGELVKFAGLTYLIPYKDMPKPYLQIGDKIYRSHNILGNSDTWKKVERSTNGVWYPLQKLEQMHLVFTYDQGILRTYINGTLDQSVFINDLQLSDLTTRGLNGVINKLLVYNRCLSQMEIKEHLGSIN